MISYKIALFRSSCQRTLVKFFCIIKRSIIGNQSNYNPSTHQGDLPVRVLQHSMLYWFERTSPEFFRLLVAEMNDKGLKPGIQWCNTGTQIIHRGKIEAASIDGDRQIKLYETFNAYLWCVSYSLFVVFDESIQIPILKGTYTGRIDQSSQKVADATSLYAYAMIIRNRYSDWDKNLPNPEVVKCDDKYYVDRTNGLFVSAMYFILCHEVGHSYFNHVDYVAVTNEQSIEDELAADNFAIDQILGCPDQRKLATLKKGAVVGLLSLLLLNSTLIPSRRYPHADTRIQNAMERLGFEELDLAWGIASLGLKFWADDNKIALNLPLVFETYQDLFYHTLHEFNTLKRI